MDEFVKTSRLTGQKYNVFDPDIARIVNLKQIIFYLQLGYIPIDICVSEDKTGKKILVYLYRKSETKEPFDRWCRYDTDIEEVK